MVDVIIKVPKRPFLFLLGELEELPHFMAKGRFDWAPVLVLTLIKVLVMVIIMVFLGLLWLQSVLVVQEVSCQDKLFDIYK